MTRRAALAAVLTALAVLHRAGGGELAAPPLGSAGEMADWVERRGAVVAAFALLRLLALAAGWYLVAVAALGAVARVGGRPRLARRIDALTLPALRRAGVGTVAAISALGTSPAWADSTPHSERPTVPAEEPTPPPTMHLLDEAPASTTSSTTSTTPPTTTPPTTSEPTTSAPIDARGSTTATTSPTSARDAAFDAVYDAADTAAADSTVSPAPVAPAPSDAGPPVTMRRITTSAPALAPKPSAEMWTIEPGESFWSVAMSHVQDHLGREPDDHEIERYWRALMAANPDASPTGDPDLVYPGTVLVLPPL